jgi:hypothetical protein
MSGGATTGGGAKAPLSVRDVVANALELLREIISQQCEPEHDGGDYDAGYQPVLKDGDCLAICPQSQPYFRIIQHGPKLRIACHEEWHRGDFRTASSLVLQ